MQTKFSYPDLDLGLELPLLVLAIKPHDHLPDLPENFQALIHQTAGIACHQHKMMARILIPRPEIRIRMEALSSRWLDTNAGAFGTNLDEIMRYRSHIQELFGADCNHSYLDFEEGLYPLDPTPELLKRLTDEELPENLDDLIQWGTGIQQLFGMIGRWKLYVLGTNSD